MADNLTRDEAAERAALLGGVRYDVTLDLTGDGATFGSSTVVHFDCVEPGAHTFVDLHAEEVLGIELNGVAVETPEGSTHRIEIGPLAQENTLVVEARCAYTATGVGLHRFVDPSDGHAYLHTQFEPFDAHRVYACFDQPDLKAPFTLTVDAPAGWVVLANGEPVEQPDHEAGGRWRFAPTPPLPTYITALVAGPFHGVHAEHDGTRLGLWCRQSLAEYLDADEMFEITRQGFDFYRDAFGFPYPFGSYDQAFVPEFNWGAMENPGIVTFTETYVFRSKVTDTMRLARAETVLHEMAHMWFGNLVTMRWWDDLWLNESFATYGSYVALATSTRFTGAWAEFAGSIKQWALQQDQLPSTHPISADIVDTESVRTHFDGITYAKGASVLRQLVAWVGDASFRSGLRAYFRAHAFGNATLDDFLHALERSSGRNLRSWSRQWLETAGVATLQPEVTDDGDVFTQVVITQEAPGSHPTVRDHRLRLGLYDRDGDALVRRDVVELDVTGERTEVAALAGVRRPDLLLLNEDDLAFAKVRLDARSAETLHTSLSGLAEPLARSVAWGSLWDMTRDAELPARTFVDTVVRHGVREHAIQLLESLFERARVGIDRFGDPTNRAAAWAGVHTAAVESLHTATPESDAQLFWVRTRVRASHTDEELAWVEALLRGDATVDGLSVDTELRWMLVTALAAAGRADADAIERQRADDDTDMGARRAATALASRPSAAAKEEAWTAVVTDPDLPLATRRAIMRGFHRHGQEELLAPFVERYVEDVPDVWESARGVEEAIDLTRGLYPDAVVAAETVAAADHLLGTSLPRPALRTIAEQRDRTLRAMRARAADTAA